MKKKFLFVAIIIPLLLSGCGKDIEPDKTNTVTNSDKNTFKAAVSDIVIEAERNKINENYKKCEEFSSYHSFMIKSCTVNYSGEHATVTIEGKNDYKKYCVYNAMFDFDTVDSKLDIVDCK